MRFTIQKTRNLSRLRVDFARYCKVWGLLFALSGCWVLDRSLAADAPPTPAVPAAPDAAGSDDSDVSAVPEEIPFKFEMGDRRDPFTFTKSVPVDTTLSQQPTYIPGTTTKSGAHSLRPEEVEAKHKEAEAICSEGERCLMDTRAAEAMGLCDRGLEIFKDVTSISDYRELQDVRERIFRLRKAAERMRQRQDAEREFSGLNLRLTGVVVREKRSQAIVNQRIVGKGDWVSTVGDSGEVVVVEDILPEQVIFLYRGFHIPLTLVDSAK